MSEPSLALQLMIWDRLTASADVLALVPASNIFDKLKCPEAFPCIIIGAGSTVYADDYHTFHDTVHAGLHVWVQEPGTTGAQRIAGAIREALRYRPWSVDGFVAHSVIVGDSVPMRDPSGEHSHIVLGVNAILQEAAA